MSLSPGDRIGSYEVLASLGAGGMGEVYRARDARLGREAAVKVLPEEFARDRDRLARFEQEARAASALNHPNIVTIYEVGLEGERSFLAMELVDGTSLRELVAGGALPVRRLLSLGAQIAEGLAKAHAAGIVHRDLKPENVMVSKDGFAKILDFGLAKLIEPDSGGVSAMPTLARPETRPGIVMGTVGYMSPEQASGEPLDFRTDQFSLGSILYEMATGQKAFQRKTSAETLAAIIREEPEPAGKLRPELPAPLRWILERCLAKDREERYASTRDLARELAGVRDHLSEVSGILEAAAVPALSRRRSRMLVAALVLLAAGAAAGWLGRAARSAKAAPPVFQRVTFRQGALGNARISADGQTVYYGATWEGEPLRVYVTRPGNPESAAPDLPANTDMLAISSKGVLAILLNQTFLGGTLATVPMAGGIPRQLVENVPYASADWSPDGRELAVVRRFGGNYRLEFPLGHVILEDPKVVLESPRFSPRGDQIAYWEIDKTTAVGVVSPAGQGRAVLSSGWAHTAGPPCWSPDGREIWFTASQPGEPDALWAVDSGGRVRIVARVPGNLELDDVSRDGRVLIAHHTLVNFLRGAPPGASAERELSWLDASLPSDLSSDGSRLLLTESGEGSGREPSVYLRGTDGSPAVRLGEGFGFALSPDGKRVLARVEAKKGQPAALILMPTGPGPVETLKTGDFLAFDWGAFLPDGRRIVFSAADKSGVGRIYVLDLLGGTPRPIGPEGATLWPFTSAVSPNGRLLIGRRVRSDGISVPIVVPVDGGESRAIPDWKLGWPVQWTADGRALYVYVMPTGEVWLVDTETGKRRLWKVTPSPILGGPTQGRFRTTPDGRAYVYPNSRAFSALYLVEGLR
jgi:Tol biopolymer transport system component